MNVIVDEVFKVVSVMDVRNKGEVYRKWFKNGCPTSMSSRKLVGRMYAYITKGT